MVEYLVGNESKTLNTSSPMKRLGLIGGTSWHSTIEYYRIINQYVNDQFGNNTNPPLLLFNLNQALVHQYQVENNWEGVAELIIDGAQRLVAAGAEAILFCANTPHKVYDVVSGQLEIPILHIADATAEAVKSKEVHSVGFLGTRYSMTEDFVTGRISQRGIEVHVPREMDELEELHRIIQQELTFGRIEASSKEFVLRSIKLMIEKGAKGIILGCTEFPLMIHSQDLQIPVFDTTRIHAEAAAKFTLNLIAK